MITCNLFYIPGMELVEHNFIPLTCMDSNLGNLDPLVLEFYHDSWQWTMSFMLKQIILKMEACAVTVMSDVLALHNE